MWEASTGTPDEFNSVHSDGFKDGKTVTVSKTAKSKAGSK
jgi:hypothetical protein